MLLQTRSTAKCFGKSKNSNLDYLPSKADPLELSICYIFLYTAQLPLERSHSPWKSYIWARSYAHPRNVSRERSRCREAVLHKCGVRSLLTESAVFGDPSSFGNKPDTRRASQQLHQLRSRNRGQQTANIHILLCLCSPHSSHPFASPLATSNLFMAPPYCNGICRCSALHLRSGWKQQCTEKSLCLRLMRSGSSPIGHRLAITVSAALQQSWTDPAADSQTGSIQPALVWHYTVQRVKPAENESFYMPEWLLYNQVP